MPINTDYIQEYVQIKLMKGLWRIRWNNYISRFVPNSSVFL